ncbi:MAG: tetratricopeptide repeat protein [Bacteroidota bacterium]
MRISFPLVLFVFANICVFAQDMDEQLAAEYFRNGEYNKAVVLYEELFENKPDSPIFYNRLLDCYIELEDLKEARKIVKSQIKRFPQEIRYEVDLGWIMDIDDNKRRSRRLLEGLISDLDKNPNSVISLANAFEFREYHDYALETYLKGRDMFGDNYPFNRQIALIYKQKQDYEAMMNEYVDMFNLGESYIEEVQGILQDAVADDPDFKKNNALRKVLIERTQDNPSNFIYSEMLLWLSIQQKDFRLALNQAKALDRRLSRGGDIVLHVAKLSKSNNDFEVAIDGFQYVINLGKENPHYLNAQIGMLDVEFLKVVSDFDFEKENLYVVEQKYEKALENLGVNAQSVVLLRNLANMKAFYLDKSDEAVELLQHAISLNTLNRRVKAECQVELADILVLIGDIWDANLLYAEVDRTFKDDPIAHEARFKNARLSYFIGEFDWAKAQLDVLKSATSKLIANDAMKLSLIIQDNIDFDEDTTPLEKFSKAEKLIYMNKRKEAELILDSLVENFPTHPILDEVLFVKSDIKIYQENYEVADSLLAFIVEHFPNDILADEALFKRAEINERIFNDPEKAIELYQKILTEYPGSIHAVVARNHFRRLRERMLN